MKEFKIYCDKDKSECQANNYASFIYASIVVTDEKQIKQKINEEHYCETHAGQIREFIKNMS